MRVNMTCKRCGQKIEPNWPKIKTVVGGSAGIMLLGLMMATPTGWLAVSPPWPGRGTPGPSFS